MTRFMRWLMEGLAYGSPDTAAAMFMLNDTKGQ